jgi:hypothetical protein
MKANHGSSFVEVVGNKAETSFEKLQQLAQQWLSLDFHSIARERHYRKIKPRIFFRPGRWRRAAGVVADGNVEMTPMDAVNIAMRVVAEAV